ncbi:MAG TPA: DUF2600 family protein [Conexibacter sp.]|nr:DUF2600 family protein [Conexibacter sp.]
MLMIALLRALALFAASIVPCVRTQLRAWECVAQTIPDPTLRAAALGSLRDKASNAEAAAVFSTLAPRRRRGEVIALLATLQILTDFLDTISEAAVADPLRSSLILHGALADAVRPGAREAGYYRHHPQHDDGGYLAQLVEFCQEHVDGLPAAGAIETLLVRAARRCGAGQSYTHDAIHRGPERLARWARAEALGSGYRWWEVAAGASSSVPLHALVALASDARTTREEAARVDAAYCPGIGSLTVLLDNLVDRDADASVGGHSYLAYYDSAAHAASRIAEIIRTTQAAMSGLRSRRRHEAILAGVLGFYLSAPGAGTDYARPVRKHVLERAGPEVSLVLHAMGVRRRLDR